MLWHKIYDRYIQLYTDDWCLPNGAKHYIPSKNIKKQHKKIEIKCKWQLRDYQLTALMHVAENEWGLIEAPTGSWKSLIVIGITNQFKMPTLVVCPTKKLVKEMVDKFKEFTDYEPWTYYSDGKNIKDITITTHMSFVSDIHWAKKLQGFGLVIVDECMVYNTLIDTDKWKLKIGDIVENKIECNVLSYNENTGNNEYRSLIWIKKEEYKDREMYEIEYEWWYIQCTWGHLIFTTNRWRIRADDLCLDDDIKSLA